VPAPPWTASAIRWAFCFIVGEFSWAGAANPQRAKAKQPIASEVNFMIGKKQRDCF
jgi:hypothetical protein